MKGGIVTGCMLLGLATFLVSMAAFIGLGPLMWPEAFYIRAIMLVLYGVAGGVVIYAML